MGEGPRCPQALGVGGRGVEAAVRGAEDDLEVVRGVAVVVAARSGEGSKRNKNISELFVCLFFLILGLFICLFVYSFIHSFYLFVCLFVLLLIHSIMFN